jgi:hypothetical protein
MTTHKIFYYKKDPGNDIVKTGEFFDTGEKHTYHHCPVWQHKSNRTFVFHSPFEFSLFANQKENKLDYSSNLKDSIEYFSFDEHEDIDEFFGSHPVFQLRYPEYYFWTESEDIWVEFMDHPLTSRNNNAIIIGGWWNLSNYPRCASMGFQVVDCTREVSVQKNDPIYRIRFYSKNFDDNFSLVEKTKLEYDESVASNLQDSIVNNRSYLQDILFKKSCPFKLLRNKKNV